MDLKQLVKCGAPQFPTNSSGKLVFATVLIMAATFILTTTILLPYKNEVKYFVGMRMGLESRDSINQDIHDSMKENMSFVATMKAFPWDLYQSSVDSQDAPEIQRLSTRLVHDLVPFLIKSPTKPINESCVAPPFKRPKTSGNLPPCKPSPSKARKVGVLWQLGFDVDAIEIHLHELNDVVDKFFIVESISCHNSFVPKKPLIWQELKYSERFAKFHDKVVHFLVDDSELVKADPGNIWSREYKQEEVRWRKFLEWNTATKYFTNDDLLGFGDADEIPNRDVVNFLKGCDFDMGTDSVDIGLWFPLDGSNTVFQSDFPVKGHKYTYGDPTFWKLSSALKYYQESGKYPTRLRNRSRWAIIGGVHFSTYAYPPMKFMKLLAATESLLRHVTMAIQFGKLFAEGKIREGENEMFLLWDARWEARTKDVETFRRENKTEAESIVKTPWFLECNRERYPGFDKKHDPRLDS